MKKICKEKLLLLGAWNEPPLVGWDWFNEISMMHFFKLSGVKMRCFTFLKDGLHYQYFLQKDANELFDKFGKLDNKLQLNFVKKIFNDYYWRVINVKNFLRQLQDTNFSSISDEDLIKILEEWIEKLPLITMQIWFAVLLDIWYPDTKSLLKIKKIAAGARDDDGYLQEGLKAELKRMVIEISKRLKIPAQKIYYLFPREIISALKKTIKPPDISARLKLFVTVYSSGQYKILSGEKAKLVLRRFETEPKAKSESGLLTGLPASPGKTYGRVHLIFYDRQFESFKKDEILVALQTMVDYVPIMKKAKAILTEFGGLTSHAAIVSRELKKPCIVGIKNLTSSLKDGNLVKVDANKGIVRIVKKVK